MIEIIQMIKIKFVNQWKHLNQNFSGISLVGVTFFRILLYYSIIRIDFLGFYIDIYLKRK